MSLPSKTFWKGIRHNPDNADLHFNAGTAYDKLNRFDDVVKSMETTLTLDPHHADAMNYPAIVMERGRQNRRSHPLTKQAVALRPTNGYYVEPSWAFSKGPAERGSGRK